MVTNLTYLKKLDYNKQLAFAYLTCERLHPNYVYFSREFEFGNQLILREAIDFVEHSLLTNASRDRDKIQSLITTVESNTPDTEDFNTGFVSSALDACTAILETLDFMLDKKTSRLFDISSFATDTVDMFIQDRDNLDFNNDSQFDKKIQDDPLMKREIQIQEGIITYLLKINQIEKLDIVNLLHLQDNNNKSNIDL